MGGIGPPGACVEPGQITSMRTGAIIIWILGALLFCCCLCLCTYFDAHEDSKDTSAQGAKGGKTGAVIHPQEKTALDDAIDAAIDAIDAAKEVEDQDKTADVV